MAEKNPPEEVVELSEEELAALAVAKAAKKKKLLVLGAIALVLLLLAAGGSWFALKAFSGKEKAEPVAEEKKAEEGTAKTEGEHSAKAGKPAFYDALDPAFLANFSVSGRQHYLQVSLTVMARDEDALAALHTHMPLVRNRIVMQLSAEQFDQLQTDDGRQQLQKKLLESIQEIMKKETGKPQIEQVFYTNFVMQ
jgi:flagellar protein FliL